MKTSPGYKKHQEETEESASTKMKEGENIHIRRIDNGYIAKHSWQEKGEHGSEYKEKEVYHEKNPLE